ncbi:MAG: citrate/2-methylcitrate synthase [Clostridia bacterium]|nr:citrate/2-methylcitrate synthase [Clostridia bacterium]
MSEKKNYSAITPQIREYTERCIKNNIIEPSLYQKYEVNRGLRDLNGNGVLTGLTEISEVKAKEIIDGEAVPCRGELYYRGYDVKKLVGGIADDGRFGFEEIAYLLLLGNLPTAEQLTDFKRLLGEYRSLPNSFTRDVIMKAPSANIMNSLARSVLTMYSYDTNAEDLSLENVLRQNLQLIATMPMLSIYAYQANNYYNKGHNSFFIHDPDPALSTAENILMMLRPDKKYTETEAHVLDIALILHAEHGGGNNLSFTTHVVTSSGTDTYSAIAAALCSLKGPKHGGSNIKVSGMFEDIKSHIRDWEDDDEIRAYLIKLLNKEAFDRAGLIYGIGHAIYSVSDPRAEVLEQYLSALAGEKGMERELMLYSKIEKLAPEVISERKKMYKGVSANIDFFSGLVYQMLGIPDELFTPLFAIARVAGWGAHRMEELINGNKIIRPAYKAVAPRRDYISLADR